MTNLKLNYVAASDRGLVRGNNEDSAYAGPHLLLLADGMGGHAAGEVASQLMVEHMEHLDRHAGNADILALLGAAADDANASINASIRANPEQEGMGTTLTALMFNGTQFGLIHVGDSRGYRLRGGQLAQITVDDTFVQSLVEQGKLNPEDVSSHPQKSLILKAYTGRPIEPHLELLDAVPGDRYLLCSDGLSDPVTHETIEGALAEGTPAEAAQRLIELALRSGGPDNITVVVADVVDTRAYDTPELPTAAALAGALAVVDDPTHPDTAASRAAKLVRTSGGPRPNMARNINDNAGTASSGGPGSFEDLGDPDNFGDHGDFSDYGQYGDLADEEGEHKRRSAWPVVLVVLALIGAGLGGAWWFDTSRKGSYFVAVDSNDEFVIEQGFNQSILGFDLHKPVQHICINDDNQIRLVENPDASGDCQRFSVSDLPASTRSRVDNLSSGSYADVTDQVNRLAEEALPVCVEDKDTTRNREQNKDNQNNPNNPDNPDNPDDRNKPDNMDSVDTAPEPSPVECREVA